MDNVCLCEAPRIKAKFRRTWECTICGKPEQPTDTAALAKPASPAGGDVREALAFVGELEALAFSKQMSQRPLDYEQVQTIFKAVASIRAALQSTSAGRVGE